MIFVSYSRSEAPLVDALATRLKDAQGVDVWVDYRNMRPTHDWQKQWQTAMDDADAVLILVSKRSMGESDAVRDEVKRALDNDCRIVLAIVEAVPLRQELEEREKQEKENGWEFEWVDMRRDLDTAVGQLGSILRREDDIGRSTSRPQSGFRAPLAVWLTAALAVPVALLSLVAAWTVIIPILLVPLPVRLLRRDFNYFAVRTSLLALPWAIQVLLFFGEDVGEGALEASEVVLGWSVLVCLALYLAIRSPWVRRWMKPAAARPFSPERSDSTRTPKAMNFKIDFRPEDAKYARLLERALEDQHHTKTDEANAKLTVRLISRFHDRDEIGPEQVVLPVLIQDPGDELPEKLRRTQWIDLRRGARRNEIDAITRLLDKPEKLLGAIGVPPPHDQLVMPAGVFALYLGFWSAVLGPLSALWFVGYAQVRYAPDPDLGGPLSFFVLAAIVMATSGWAAKAVRERRPGVPFRWLSVAVTLGLLAIFLMTRFAEVPDDTGSSLVDSAAIALVFPIVWLPLSWAFGGSSIGRWIPASTQDSARELPIWISLTFRLLALAFAVGVLVFGDF